MATEETALYLPVKRFLEKLGYEPKGEICGCDVVALSAGDPPLLVVCELKLQFNLELLLQGVNRAAACDEVWLAGRMSTSRRGRERDPRFRALCRRLGFGLLGVLPDGSVQTLLTPVAPLPRRDPRRRSMLIAEHRRRRGDPAAGGSTRKPIMTAYRQEALACAGMLGAGPLRLRELTALHRNAPKIVRRNVYGWFARQDRGIYALTSAGLEAIRVVAKADAAVP